MKIILNILLTSFLSLFALDIQINTSNQNDVSPLESQKMSEMWKKRNLMIDKKEAKKLVIENKALSNAFLDNNLLNSNLKADISIFIEEKLAEAMVNNNINNTLINDKILRSYYEDNKYDFFAQKKINFSIYFFETFDEALSFYNIGKKDLKNIPKYVEENNVTKRTEDVEITRLHNDLKRILQDDIDVPYITPIGMLRSKYIILVVNSIVLAHVKPYKEVRKEVKKLLQKKIVLDRRKSLLKKYLYEVEK